MLIQLQQRLISLGLVDEDWAEETLEQGRKVDQFRDYYAGEHEMSLTKEMKRMLNLSEDVLDRFCINYCGMVIAAAADRLTLEGVQVAGNQEQDPAQAWIDDLLNDNRLDALQIKVREAALRDGETFVMVQPRPDGQMPLLAHEPAWDGESGVIAVLADDGAQIAAAIKIWYVGERRRGNLYLLDRVEKYWIGDTGDLESFSEAPERAEGIPLVRFCRKDGISELTDVLPLQKALNRALVDMVMASLLSGFSMLWAKGWRPKQTLTPGMILVAEMTQADGSTVVPQTEEQARAMQAILSSIDLKRIEPGDLKQLIDHAKFLIDQIGVISSTPLPGMLGGDTQSGDALRQRDIRLLGKINSAQVSFGNAWEDVVQMAARLERRFNQKNVPDLERLTAKWKSGEIRNNADVLALFKLLHDAGYEREALRVLGQSTLIDLSEDKIEMILAEKAADGARALAGAVGSLPDFGNFNLAPAG